jgi:hypothetical protein
MYSYYFKAKALQPWQQSSFIKKSAFDPTKVTENEVSFLDCHNHQEYIWHLGGYG